jgi:hypothetical protein
MPFPYPDRPSGQCENYINGVRCKNRASEKHHCFSQTKRNKKVYGKLIHHPINTRGYCYGCHHGKSIEKWDEAKYREKMSKAGIQLPAILKPTGKCRREDV